MKATVSARGQVTIPKRLGEQLGIRPGEVLEFEEEQGKLVGVKLESVDPLLGAFPSEQTTDQFIEELRGPVELGYGILGRGKSTDDFMRLVRDAPET
jgi:AbrB family looped-hinge helix DNA binding protein